MNKQKLIFIVLLCISSRCFCQDFMVSASLLQGIPVYVKPQGEKISKYIGFVFRGYKVKENKFGLGYYASFIGYQMDEVIVDEINTPFDYFEKTTGNNSSLSLGLSLTYNRYFIKDKLLFTSGVSGGVNFTNRNSFRAIYVPQTITNGYSSAEIIIGGNGIFRSFGEFINLWSEIIYLFESSGDANLGILFGIHFDHRYSQFNSVYSEQKNIDTEAIKSEIKEKSSVINTGFQFGFVMLL